MNFLHRLGPDPHANGLKTAGLRVSGELKPTRNGRFENRGFLRVDFLR